MLDDEKRAELAETVTDMRMLAETVKTDGWQKILKPLLIELRQAAFGRMARVDTLPELYKNQAAVESIDLLVSDESRNIEGDIDRRIREGIEAVEVLTKEKT